MAHWEDNKLWHNWFGHDKAEFIGELNPNTDKRKTQRFVFTSVEVMGKRFVRYYYETPPARIVLESFMLWKLDITNGN